MSVAETNNQSVAVVPKVYNLDAVGSAVIAGSFKFPSLNLFPDINTMNSIGASIQQVIEMNQRLGISQLLEDVQKLSDSIMEPYKAMQKMLATSLATELQKSLASSLAINFRFNPLGLAPNQRVQEPAQATAVISNGALDVTVDQLGFLWLGGRQITRAHTKTSRHGQLLNWFEGNKGELVTEEQMKNYLKVTDPKQVMKDLKKDLRELGYKLWYERYRRQGVIYRGILKKDKL